MSPSTPSLPSAGADSPSFEDAASLNKHSTASAYMDTSIEPEPDPDEEWIYIFNRDLRWMYTRFLPGSRCAIIYSLHLPERNGSMLIMTLFPRMSL